MLKKLKILFLIVFIPPIAVVSFSAGLIRSSENACLDDFYASDRKFSEGLAPVKIDNKFGYIDKEGKIAIKPSFDQVSNFSDGVARVETGGKWKYIDKQAQVVIQPSPTQQESYSFSQGLAAVKIDGKWGYMDKQGKVVIEAKFDAASNFSEGLAAVKVDNKIGYINDKGNLTIAPQFSDATDFSEGLAAVKIDNEFAYIDKRGKVVIKSDIYKRVEKFSDGLALVKKGNKYGYINKEGKTVIEPQYPSAAHFSNGLASVSILNEDNKIKNAGYINQLGKVVLSPEVDQNSSYFEELKKFIFGYGKYRTTTQSKFIRGNSFSEYLAAVDLSPYEYGYINTRGEVVIKLRKSQKKCSV